MRRVQSVAMSAVVAVLISVLMATIAPEPALAVDDGIVEPVPGALVLDVVEAPDGRLGVLMIVGEPHRPDDVRLGLMEISPDHEITTRFLPRPTALASFDLASTDSGWVVAYTDGATIPEMRTSIAIFDDHVEIVDIELVDGFVRFDSADMPTMVFITQLRPTEFAADRFAVDFDPATGRVSPHYAWGTPADQQDQIRVMVDAIRLADGRLVTLEGDINGIHEAYTRMELTVEAGPDLLFLGVPGHIDAQLWNSFAGFGFVYADTETGEMAARVANNPAREGDQRNLVAEVVAGNGATFHAVRQSLIGSQRLLSYTSLQHVHGSWTSMLLPPGLESFELAGARIRGGVVTAVGRNGVIVTVRAPENGPALSDREPAAGGQPFNTTSVQFGAVTEYPVVADTLTTDGSGSLGVSFGSFTASFDTSCIASTLDRPRAFDGLSRRVGHSMIRADGSALMHLSSPGTTEATSVNEVIATDGISWWRALLPAADTNGWLIPHPDRSASLFLAQIDAGVSVTVIDDRGRRRSAPSLLRITNFQHANVADVVFSYDPSSGVFAVALVENDPASSELFFIDGATGAELSSGGGSGPISIAADPLTSRFHVASLRAATGDISLSTQGVVGGAVEFERSTQFSAPGAEKVALVADSANGRVILFVSVASRVDVYEVDVATNATPNRLSDAILLTSIPVVGVGTVEQLRATFDPDAGRGLIALDGDRLHLVPFATDGTTVASCAGSIPPFADREVPVAAASPVEPTVSPAEISPTGRSGARSGYWLVDRAGEITAFGDAPDFGRVSSSSVVDVTATPGGAGYWILEADGSLVALGQAARLASAPMPAGVTAVAFASTPSGLGGWIFTDAGHAFAVGDAPNLGGLSGLDLAAPIIDAVAKPDGTGLYLVAGDGGVFTLGSAQFLGSVPQILPGVALAAPVIGLVPTPDGSGYWLVAGDGGVFSFAAPFVGSIPAVLPPGAQLDAAITGMVSFGGGYLLVGADGGVFNFSELPFDGSLGGQGVSDVVAVEPFRGNA